MKNKYYFPIIFVFIVAVFFTVYKPKDLNSNNDVIKLSPMVNEINESSKKLTIYGSYHLSTNIEDAISHDYFCKKSDCIFITGNDNYAIINDDGILIYGLNNNQVYSLNTIYELEKAYLLVNNDSLYGIIINYQDHEFYYSLKDDNYYLLGDNYKISDSSKYVVNNNQLIIVDEDKYSLINYLTNEHLIDASYIEINNYLDDYLIVVKDSDDNIINLYDKELNSIMIDSLKDYMLYNKKYILTNDYKTYIVKDKNSNIIKRSKEYDMIYDFINGFIIAELNNNLLIVDCDDNVVKSIHLNGNSYDSLRSGYYNEADNYLEGIYLYIGNELNYKEIYFNPKTYELTEKEI